jgi:hypothetical protein
VKLFDPVTALLAGAVFLFCVVIAYWAWIWRLAWAEQLAGDDERGREGLATGPSGP